MSLYPSVMHNFYITVQFSLTIGFSWWVLTEMMCVHVLVNIFLVPCRITWKVDTAFMRQWLCVERFCSTTMLSRGEETRHVWAKDPKQLQRHFWEAFRTTLRVAVHQARPQLPIDAQRKIATGHDMHDILSSDYSILHFNELGTLSKCASTIAISLLIRKTTMYSEWLSRDTKIKTYQNRVSKNLSFDMN